MTGWFFNNVTCILLKRIGYFNNITCILLKWIRHFECIDVYGGRYIIGGFLIIYMPQ